MKIVDRLVHIFGVNLPFHRARINCIAGLVLAVIKSTSVNLTSLATILNPQAKIDSNYRRLQRLFAEVDLNSHIVGRLLVSLAPKKSNIVVSIDRTEWGRSNRRVNLLVASATIGKLTLPIAWFAIPIGNSSTKHRCALLDRILRIIPKERISAFLADREFFGKPWFTYLDKHGIPFYIRVRVKTPTHSPKGMCSVQKLFPTIKVGQIRKTRRARIVYGVPVFVTVKHRKSDPIYLVSSCYDSTALQTYQRRWTIETMFQDYKGRGFKLEATRLFTHERIERLFSIISLAYAWAQLTGLWREQHEPRKQGSHGRLRKSRFRYGLDYLQWILSLFIELPRKHIIGQLLRLLRPPRPVGRMIV